MKRVNNNISIRTYKIVGFENSGFFSIDYTIAELLSNSGDDTELLYSIQENYIDKIISLEVGQTLYIESSRDNTFGCGSIVCRTS